MQPCVQHRDTGAGAVGSRGAEHTQHLRALESQAQTQMPWDGKRLRQNGERGSLRKTKESRSGNIARRQSRIWASGGRCLIWNMCNHATHTCQRGAQGGNARKARISLWCLESGFLTGLPAFVLLIQTNWGC